MKTKMICSRCGETGIPKAITKGSIWIELLLWCFFLIPGLIYSLWRMFSRYDGCQSCGSTELVTASSPRGKKVARMFNEED